MILNYTCRDGLVPSQKNNIVVVADRVSGFIYRVLRVTRASPAGHLISPQLHPLVAPHVSHFSQVPLRTMVKFWHSEQLLPV